MSDINIEKDIPIPTTPTSSKIWPLEQMDVGDSFAIPENRTKALRAKIHRVHISGDMRFTVRKVDSDTCRCWRTK